MERLTVRDYQGEAHSVSIGYYALLDKLADYEDKQEQGLLIELPCPIGTTVYALECDEENFEHFKCNVMISEYTFDYEMIDLFGKCVFLTRSEAESALAKMGGK